MYFYFFYIYEVFENEGNLSINAHDDTAKILRNGQNIINEFKQTILNVPTELFSNILLKFDRLISSLENIIKNLKKEKLSDICYPFAI